MEVKLFERDAAGCEKISRVPDSTMVLHADGTEEATLKNIGDARAWVRATPSASR